MNVLPLRHLGVIMDGNRRWASKHHLVKSEGHRVGVEHIHDLTDWCLKLNIKEVTLYTFSIDNWKRDKKEVSYLFSLVALFFKKYINECNEKGIRVNWIGIKDDLPKSVIETLKRAEKKTKKNKNLTLNLAFNYSGSIDLITASKNIAKAYKNGKLNLSELDKKTYRKYALSSKVTPIDLLIRTSGELRLSDFMPIQLSYAELYFTSTYWPAFTYEELLHAISEYYMRNRKFGGE